MIEPVPKEHNRANPVFRSQKNCTVKAAKIVQAVQIVKVVKANQRDAAVFAPRASGYVKITPRQVAEPRMNADLHDLGI
jgi:flagellar basal body rod protein FlgC